MQNNNSAKGNNEIINGNIHLVAVHTIYYKYSSSGRGPD